MASISSVKEALREIKNIRELSESVKLVPGLAEGELEDIYHRANKFMNTYSEMSRKQYRAFRRELDELAEEVSDLFKDELLSKKHAKILDKMLKKLKIRDFYSARRLLWKFNDIIALNDDLNTSLEEYRRFYQGLENEIERKKAEKNKLRTVPKPAMSQKDVNSVVGTIEDCNARVKRLMFDYISGHPSHEVLRTMLWAGTVEGLKIPNPDNKTAAIELVNQLDFNEETRKAFGNKNLHALVAAMGYTDARFQHYLKDYRSFRRLLHENSSWLRGLSTAGGYSPNFSFDDEPKAIRTRIDAWLEMLSNVPHSQEVVDLLKKLAEIIESGALIETKETAQLYREYGDMARRAWDGTIEKLMEDTEDKISELIKNKERLPHPDKVIQISGRSSG